MAYQEISDDFWKKVEPLLAPFKRKKIGWQPAPGRPAHLNGILYVLKTGCQWHYLPPCHGSKSTVHAHFQNWVSAGVFAEIFRLKAEDYQALHQIRWTWQAINGMLVQAPVRGQPVGLEDEALDAIRPIWDAVAARLICMWIKTGSRWG